MKIILAILSILSGIIIVRFLPQEQVVTFKNEQTPCDSLDSGSQNAPLRSSVREFRCLPILANAGMIHDRSEVQSRSKIASLFNEGLKAFYDAPNEFNVVTNQNGFGKSSQKYDPREDLYFRFPRTEKWDKKLEYGFLKDLSAFKEIGTTTGCVPEFSKIKDAESEKFFKTLREMNFRVPHSYRSENQHTEFTFLMILSYFMRTEDQSIFNRYKFHRNSCSGAISAIVNFCIVNPSYDLQYEDFFIFPTKNGMKVGARTYCKSSHQKSWSLISEKTYDL